MSITKRAYKFRWYPTVEQRQILARTFGCTRWVYNWALVLKSRVYREEGKCLSYGDLSALLSVLKAQAETAWLAEVSSVVLQQSLRHLDRAFVNFFAGRARYPHFKSKKRDSSYKYGVFGCRAHGATSGLLRKQAVYQVITPWDVVPVAGSVAPV